MRLRRSRTSPNEPAPADLPALNRADRSASPFPSIWVGSYADADAWQRDAERRDAALAVFDGIDDRLLSSRHAFDMDGWCAGCEAVRPMAYAWHLGHVNPEGSVNPAWTEIGCCHECGLVSRMRALFDLLRSVDDSARSVYVAERVTASYPLFERLYPEVVGSEFLGDDHERGRNYAHASGVDVRHEDMTALTFADDEFDLVVTQDVFEHIPDFDAAFEECRRVLRPGGRLVFTVPFFANQPTTEIRATVDDAGNVEHLLAPEIHGNPIGEGSLCFQHFGWDLLDAVRNAGFGEARANLYWGPWAGHLGYPVFVFDAG